jgi:hypothetical protein
MLFLVGTLQRAIATHLFTTCSTIRLRTIHDGEIFRSAYSMTWGLGGMSTSDMPATIAQRREVGFPRPGVAPHHDD